MPKRRIYVRDALGRFASTGSMTKAQRKARTGKGASWSSPDKARRYQRYAQALQYNMANPMPKNKTKKRPRRIRTASGAYIRNW